MGWKTLCCVQPKVPDQRETPRQIPATSFHKTGDSQFQAAQTPGGRTLLVTAQSGSAQDFEGHLRPTPKVPSQLPVPCKAQTSKDTEADGDGVATCNGPCSDGEEQQPAARSDSCPVGKQRPPGSLLEASQRRRRNVAARLPARHGAGLTQRTGLDDQQLTTIMRFMSVYQGQLEGTGFQLEEEMSPLLCNGLVLRAHDGKVYTGKAAALRRLQHGISTLQRMAGKEAAVAKSVMENFNMELPVKAGDNQWVVKYAVKRGLFRINIRNTFSMENHLIAGLHVTRS